MALLMFVVPKPVPTLSVTPGLDLQRRRHIVKSATTEWLHTFLNPREQKENIPENSTQTCIVLSTTQWRLSVTSKLQRRTFSQEQLRKTWLYTYPTRKGRPYHLILIKRPKKNQKKKRSNIHMELTLYHLLHPNIFIHIAQYSRKQEYGGTQFIFPENANSLQIIPRNVHFYSTRGYTNLHPTT